MELADRRRALILLLAIVAAAMLRPTRTSLPAWVLIGVSVLAVTPRFPVPAEPVRIPSFFTGQSVRSIPEGSVALVLPYARLVNSRAMFWQSAAGMRFRMPEGYALLPGPHFSPPPTATGGALAAIESGAEAPAVTEALKSQVLADLSAWQVQNIIVGPMSHQDRAVAFLTAVLGRAPDQRDGVFLWRL